MTAEHAAEGVVVDPRTLSEARQFRDDFTRFLSQYSFGMREVETKMLILREDFENAHAYNPIENVETRLKTADSIADKVMRRGIDPDLESIRTNILDIAGVRVTCSFVTDVYRMFNQLRAQDDVQVREIKDYIANPKPNGYKSLHAIVDVPVFLSTGKVRVPVEVQFRTIAMDFWASLEHKTYYKYDKQVPKRILDSLRDAALTAGELDERMERIHREIHGSASAPVRPLRIVEDDGGAQRA
ncbi:GTP pyrophosphokinase [Microbacterium halophytorum]|uniref:GTP pyrophosphokinase n=1 Tax=Microbacterium halophytorum TaxID=2067568 RepID=UPI000CFCD119|nr:GTP pyrophosphokinase family protein [Microbacterium halophytorum]